MGVLFSIIGIIITWFIVGAIINFVAYHNVPMELRGHSQGAKSVHILVNLITVIITLKNIT